MLTRLYADNFRCLTNFELRLDETNILLGPNGTGKTSVLDVLHRIQQFAARGVRVEEAFPARELTLTQVRDEQCFELDLELGGGTYHYALRITHDRRGGGSRISEERLDRDGESLVSCDGAYLRLYDDDGTEGFASNLGLPISGVFLPKDVRRYERVSRFREVLQGFVIASPCPPLFASEAAREDEFLDPRMENFVGWYRHAAQANMGRLAKLFEALRETLPGFDSIDLTKSAEEARVMKVAFLGESRERKADRYRFGQLSDGQRALVALYCLIFLTRSPQTCLFLDEPDNYLALREIQPWLAAAAGKCGDTLEQVVVASHHPVTIDYMAGAKGRWFYRDGNGPVRVSDQPDRPVDGISLSEMVARGWERE